MWYLVRHNTGWTRTTNTSWRLRLLYSEESRRRWSWRRNVSSTSASSCTAWDHPSSGRMSYSSEAETAATIQFAAIFCFGCNWTRDKALGNAVSLSLQIVKLVHKLGKCRRGTGSAVSEFLVNAPTRGWWSVRTMIG